MELEIRTNIRTHMRKAFKSSSLMEKPNMADCVLECIMEPPLKKTEAEIKAARKESKKRYESTSQIIRISKATYVRWNRVKVAKKMKTNDQIATALLDLWCVTEFILVS